MLRILLFLVTNVGVMVVLTIAVKVLGLEEAMAAQGAGIDLPALLVMAGIIGMGGSILAPHIQVVGQAPDGPARDRAPGEYPRGLVARHGREAGARLARK